MRPAAGPTSTGRTASPSTPGRPSSPPPSCWRSSGALCGRRLADDVELRPVSPFYRIRFDDGEDFDYSGDPAAMRAEVARFAPGDVAGYERFLAASEAIFRVGFERLGHVPFGTWTDMARVRPTWCGWQLSHRLRPRLAATSGTRGCASVLSFHPLLVGGNPFAATSIYA